MPQLTYRPLDFSLEIPPLADHPIAIPVQDMGQKYISVALDLTDDLIAAKYGFALTIAEARDLHAALGTALEQVTR